MQRELKVDVVMCTWNSNKPYFVDCLHSIKKEVPLHHFILVDRFSDDGTIKTVRNVFPHAVVKKFEANLGVARKYGAGLVDTEFFAFIDDDIVLSDGWFTEITKHIDRKTGAVHGRPIEVQEHIQNWFEWAWRRWAKKMKKPVVTATIKNPDIIRGYTHNTLLRKCVVNDWNPPSLISSYEDHLLLRHVVRKGYVWKFVWNLTVKHYGAISLSDSLKKARWNIAGARLIKYNDLSFWSLMKTSPKGIIKAFFASLETGDPIILPYVAIGQLFQIQGWIGATKYLVMKR